jgi:hypothetical protein
MPKKDAVIAGQRKSVSQSQAKENMYQEEDCDEAENRNLHDSGDDGDDMYVFVPGDKWRGGS